LLAVTVIRESPFINTGIPSRFLLQIHTGEIFDLAAIYPILNGLGLIGLLVTGLSMSGLFRKNKEQAKN
jgi:hypothetical protein